MGGKKLGGQSGDRADRRTVRGVVEDGDSVAVRLMDARVLGDLGDVRAERRTQQRKILRSTQLIRDEAHRADVTLRGDRRCTLCDLDRLGGGFDDDEDQVHGPRTHPVQIRDAGLKIGDEHAFPAFELPEQLLR